MQEPIPDKPVSRTFAASIKAQFAPRRVLMNAVMVLYCLALFFIFDFLYSTVTGPFTVDNRITTGPLPYSIRLCSSSQVLRASPQILPWQLIGELPRDSTTRLDLYPSGTCSESGPFFASALSPAPLQLDPASATEIGPFSV